MSKATVVTMLPFEFRREMRGHNPAAYDFPAAKDGDFEVVVVEDSTDWVYVLEGKSIQRRHLAIDVAREMIDTYITASMFTSENAQPGVFYVEGEHDKESIEENFPDLLEKYREMQNNWYVNLVKEADDHWAKNKIHRNISDPQRLAARALGLKREWILRAQDRQFEDCKYCGSPNKLGISVCPVCKGVLRKSDYAAAGA